MKIVLKELDNTNTSLIVYQYIDDTIIFKCDVVNPYIKESELILLIDRSILEYCLLNNKSLDDITIRREFGELNN